MVIKFKNINGDVLTTDSFGGDVYSQIRNFSEMDGKSLLQYISEMEFISVEEIGYSLEEIKDVANDKNYIFKIFMQHEVDKEFGDTENGRLLLLLDRLDDMLSQDKNKLNIFYYVIQNLDLDFKEIFEILKFNGYTTYFCYEDYGKEYFEFITEYSGEYNDYMFKDIDFYKIGQRHLNNGCEYDFEVDGYIYSLVV